MGLLKKCGGCNAWTSRHRVPIREMFWEGCPFHRLSSRVTVSKGGNLFHAGDQISGVFSLSNGLVALERVSENGNLVIFKILQPGAFFPCSSLLRDGLHTTTARALTHITACFIPMDRLAAAIRDDPSVSAALIKLSAAEIRENEDAIFRLCSVSLPDRVLDTLTMLAEELGDQDANGDLHLTLPMAWSDFSAMVGSGPEVISRLLRRLVKSGRISFTKRHVTLHRTREHFFIQRAGEAPYTFE